MVDPKKTARKAISDEEVFAWLIAQPCVRAQAFFWNYKSRRERRNAMKDEMIKELSKPKMLI